jgi:S-methylmethionine-dependent homocysteine/selenocysteine methylase
LIFHDGLALPDFAAFDVLRQPEGSDALRKYFRSYAEIARRHGVGVVLETATWRASADWAARLGYSREELADANRQAVDLLEEIRREFQDGKTPVVISGCIGPRGDGYNPTALMTVDDAEAYHAEQITTFAATSADLVTAITMNYVEEAIGVTRAAVAAAMPIVISFTVETDGRLATGQTLQSAIEQVDAETSSAPAYYMINCAHPTHFSPTLRHPAAWIDRIRGIRANASAMSHAQLNESPVLDEGNPEELGAQYAQLRTGLKNLTVMGGCCGTDDRHVESIARACVPLFGGGMGTA